MGNLPQLLLHPSLLKTVFLIQTSNSLTQPVWTTGFLQVSHLCLSRLDMQLHCHAHMASRDLNSGPLTCIASILTTETYSQMLWLNSLLWGKAPKAPCRAMVCLLLKLPGYTYSIPDQVIHTPSQRKPRQALKQDLMACLPWGAQHASLYIPVPPTTSCSNSSVPSHIINQETAHTDLSPGQSEEGNSPSGGLSSLSL